MDSWEAIFDKQTRPANIKLTNYPVKERSRSEYTKVPRKKTRQQQAMIRRRKDRQDRIARLKLVESLERQQRILEAMAHELSITDQVERGKGTKVSWWRKLFE